MLLSALFYHYIVVVLIDDLCVLHLVLTLYCRNFGGQIMSRVVLTFTWFQHYGQSHAPIYLVSIVIVVPIVRLQVELCSLPLDSSHTQLPIASPKMCIRIPSCHNLKKKKKKVEKQEKNQLQNQRVVAMLEEEIAHPKPEVLYQ